MQGTVAKFKNFDKSRTFDQANFCAGRLVQITKQGRALVDYPGNQLGPIEARSVVAEFPKDRRNREKNLPVLLVFENGNPASPIIVGIIRDTLYSVTSSEEITLPVKRPGDGTIDGKKIIIDAKQEIVLRCGKSSVILRKDGKILVKGINITSRASRTHKIKGSSININ